jgi:hypothetical protein
MDWVTLLASLGGSTLLIIVFGYVLRESFLRRIELEFEKLKAETAAGIAERARRESMLFDQQFSAAKTSLALVYRSRNAARELVESLKAPTAETNVRALQETVSQLHGALESLLYAERAVLPRPVFVALHDLKHLINSFLMLVDRSSGAAKSGTSEKAAARLREHRSELEAQYSHIDREYASLSALLEQFVTSTPKT